MSTQGPPPAWRVIISADKLDALKADRVFQDLILLQRATNALRFAMGAGLDQGVSDGVTAHRQRAGSYFYLAAILEETFILVERIGRSMHRFPGWKEVSNLRKTVNTKDLRAEVLGRLRNQAVFHNDDVVAEKGLQALRAGDYILAQGDASGLLDVRYTLADYTAIAFALDGFTQPLGDDPFRTLLRATADLAGDLLAAADKVIGEVANSFGLELEDLTTDEQDTH